MSKPPCDCVERNESGHWINCCECSNRDDGERAAAWCATANAEGCFASLYNSEINFSVSCFWDGGYEIKLGDVMNGWRAEGNVRTWAEVSPWLRAQAVKHFPNSEFAKAEGRS